MAIAAQSLEKARKRRVYYPSSDGKPMGETAKHVRESINGISVLDTHFANRPDVYVMGDNFIYYEEGNPKACVAPDVYVVFGVGKEPRDSYKVWEEGGRTPSVVFEFTSKKTRHEDTGKKFTLYQQDLCVPEYILFDPTGDYLAPPLQGYRLENGVYVPIPLQNGFLHSEQLALDITWEGTEIRFYDPVKRAWLLRALEMAHRMETEARRAETQAQRAEAEARRANDAEAEIERLRAEIAAMKEKRD